MTGTDEIVAQNFYSPSKSRAHALRPGRGAEAAKSAKRHDDASIYKLFPTQKQAFQYADERPHLQLHAWAYEIDSGGRRSFVVASYDSFWTWYARRIRYRTALHFYEIIRTGSACKLYFDLEYNREANTGVDGDMLLRRVVDAVKSLGASRGASNAGACVVLDSTTLKKWSKHVIFCNVAFYNATRAGEFVRDACRQMEEEHPGTLMVQGADGAAVPFVDFAVYTRNRCFRLVASSKFGRDARLLPEGHAVNARISVGKDLFLKALVCNVPGTASIIGKPCAGWARGAWKRSTYAGVPHEADKTGSGSGEQAGGGAQRLDDYIMSVVGAAGGGIHGVTQLRGAVAYTIKGGYKWCGRIGRHHKSNNVILIIDVRTHEMFQKCFDPDCKNYCSPPISVPAAVFADGSVARDDDITDEDLCAMMDELDSAVLAGDGGAAGGVETDLSDDVLNALMESYEQSEKSTD